MPAIPAKPAIERVLLLNRIVISFQARVEPRRLRIALLMLLRACAFHWRATREPAFAAIRPAASEQFWQLACIVRDILISADAKEVASREKPVDIDYYSGGVLGAAADPHRNPGLPKRTTGCPPASGKGRPCPNDGATAHHLLAARSECTRAWLSQLR